jgi:uncharacterized protein YaiI (UPF0178 family)
MTTLATIWTDRDASEVLFLIAAVAFALEVVLIVLANPNTSKYVGTFAAIGLTLIALGWLAL